MSAASIALSPDKVIEVVCRVRREHVPHVLAHDRSEHVALTRHLCCYYLSQSPPGLNVREIGRIMGNRHHTTILHSLREVGNRRATEHWFPNMLDEIAAALCRECDMEESC